MGKDFFKTLPSELIIDILSRLPVRTAVICKCVDKSWCSLIETPGFVESYKSVPCLAVFYQVKDVKAIKVYEVEDELNLDYARNSFNLVFHFDFPYPAIIHSSTNGLLLLCHFQRMGYPLRFFICNPVTREYINLPTVWVPRRRSQFLRDTYGFGVSKKSGEYKVVRIIDEGSSAEIVSDNHLMLVSDYCQVYTLGTGSWRSVASTTRLVYICGTNSVGVFVNGSLHWLAYDLNGSSLWISRVDLETELFTMFSPPHLDAPGSANTYFMILSSLGDCLSLCDNSSEHEVVIWLMNTYGDEKSWTKQFVIAKPQFGLHSCIWPIKVLQDGDAVLITGLGYTAIQCYSNKTKTMQRADMNGLTGYGCFATAVCYTPRFHPLRSFPMENVSSF